MDITELLEKLDIDSPSELVYFEQFADLMEDPEDISYDAISALTEGMEPSVLSELVGGYFEDIMQSVPDDEDDVYTLLHNIDTTLQTLASSGEDEPLRLFNEELYRFRSWYLFEPCVLCSNLTDGTEQEITLLEALANCRAKNFTDDDYDFDFTNALSFQLDEYIISLGALLEDGYGDGDSDEEMDDYLDQDDDE